MGWKWGSSPKKGTAQPCQRGVNVDHKKSLGNCLYDGIYIMMAHNVKIYIFFMWNIWWQNIDELQVMNLLKELFIWNVVPIPQC